MKTLCRSNYLRQVLCLSAGQKTTQPISMTFADRRICYDPDRIRNFLHFLLTWWGLHFSFGPFLLRDSEEASKCVSLLRIETQRGVQVGMDGDINLSQWRSNRRRNRKPFAFASALNSWPSLKEQPSPQTRCLHSSRSTLCTLSFCVLLLSFSPSSCRLHYILFTIILSLWIFYFLMFWVQTQRTLWIFEKHR